MKRNYWKIATAILIPFIFVLIIIDSTINKIDTEEQVDLQAFSITQEEFQSFIDVNQDKDSFQICNLPSGGCVEIKKMVKKE